MSKTELFAAVKVGDKVLEEQGHTYDRTYALSIGTVQSVSKTRFKVAFARKDSDPRISDFYKTGKSYGQASYYHHECEPLTDEGKQRFFDLKERTLAERNICFAGEKIEKAYRDHVRDDREKKVSTANLNKANELVDKIVELLTPKEES